VWRSGVTLQWEEGTMAEVVENQYLRQIVIRVSGVERKRRLSELRKALHGLHEIFQGLKYNEMVACNCPDCINSANPTTFALQSLEDDAKHGEQVKCRNGTRKTLFAWQILDGIEYVDETRIFISYSHRDETYKDEFRKMIRPMEREGQWKIWDDRWLLPGDNWNREILRHLSEANVIILMVTSDFFNSDFIYDIEMSRAIQRHEAGDALVIGILVSDCLWEETPLHKIQMIPIDALPVDQHHQRNAVWKAIAKKIKETILVYENKQRRKSGWNN